MDPTRGPIAMARPSPEQHVRWHALADVPAIHAAAAARVRSAAERAIAARGRFLLVLAGGRTPQGAYELLSRASAHWASWHVYFGDERCLAPEDPQRNSRMARVALLDRVPIPAAQVHVIRAELGPQEAAKDYDELLRPLAGFDLVLLGLGEDGHTASLFPGDARGLAPDAPDALPVLDAPKPPAQRVTLSARRLSRTAEAIFLVDGDSKRDAIERWRSGERIPAAAVAPRGGVDVLVEAALLSGR
jgi:6-phosphogluconolactonase